MSNSRNTGGFDMVASTASPLARKLCHFRTTLFTERKEVFERLLRFSKHSSAQKVFGKSAEGGAVVLEEMNEDT